MPSEREASKLKLSDSCGQNAQESKYLNINFGVDLLTFNLKLKTQLDKKRSIQRKLIAKNISTDGFSYSPKNIQRRDLEALKKISKKTDLVSIFPNTTNPKWIVFRNESRFLIDTLKGRGVLGRRTRALDLEPLEFIFTMAQEIRVYLDNKSFLTTQKDWSNYSWGMLGHVLFYGVGQERIGKKLGLSRQNVNNAFNKKTPIEFKIENTFIPVTKELESHIRFSPNERDQRLNQINPGVFRTLPNGQIVRQWVNRYSISKEWLSNFKIGTKTFKHSNKALNNNLYKKNELTENLDTSLLAVRIKERSLKKAEERQEQVFETNDQFKRFKKTQGIRGGAGRILNYREFNRVLYVDHIGEGIRTLPTVLKTEVESIYRAGFKLPFQIYGEQNEEVVENVELTTTLNSISINNNSTLINEFLLKEERIRKEYKKGEGEITEQQFNLSQMSNRLYQTQKLAMIM